MVGCVSVEETIMSMCSAHRERLRPSTSSYQQDRSGEKEICGSPLVLHIGLAAKAFVHPVCHILQNCMSICARQAAIFTLDLMNGAALA